MKVLVACEFSGVIRDAFRKREHAAFSCDIVPSEMNRKFHIQDDVLRHLDDGWDLMICHPPCTFLAVSGAKWFKERSEQQKQALGFVKALMNAPIPRIALENPISVISRKVKKPNQIIQPWMFGHGETKATCLWLKNLPKLKPTKLVKGRIPRVHHMPPSENRGKERSRTLEGIAEVMADQWGELTKDKVFIKGWYDGFFPDI